MTFTHVESMILKFIIFPASSKNLHCTVSMPISSFESPVDGRSYFILHPSYLKMVVFSTGVLFMVTMVFGCSLFI